MCVGVNISEQISIWKHQIIDYRDPENKTGGLGGEKIKTMKHKKYNESRTKTTVTPPGEWNLNEMNHLGPVPSSQVNSPVS